MPTLKPIWLLSFYLSFATALWVTVAHAQPVSQNAIVQAALTRTQQNITYDGRYFSIPYPLGDIPKHLGVCTDVVIRSYRQVGIDLQQLVHEDMLQNFSKYPSRWGLKRPDANIDHRRVPNLEVFWKRGGFSLPATKRSADYLPGDLVTWDLDPGQRELPHVGIVVPSPTGHGRPWIVHNIGSGPVLEDSLFSWAPRGHYRFFPKP